MTQYMYGARTTARATLTAQPNPGVCGWVAFQECGPCDAATGASCAGGASIDGSLSWDDLSGRGRARLAMWCLGAKPRRSSR
jgi:hypothetical protein